MNAAEASLYAAQRAARSVPAVRPRAPESREVAFFLLHVPIGVALRMAPGLVLAHSLAVLALGLVWSQSQRTVHRAVAAAAYIAGAEVLWRMNGGTVFYEFAKYAVALLLLASVRKLPGWRQPSSLALGYFLLLLPSAALTLSDQGWGDIRRQLSFNLSGPFALAVAAYVLSGCSYKSLPLRKLLVAFAAPILGISAVAAHSVGTSEAVVFRTSSNFVTSGGFGPNQVSAVLGLGAVLCLFLAVQTRGGVWRLIFLGLSLLQLVQSVITFSRGGVINAVACIGVLGVHMVRNRRTRLTLLSALVLFAVLGTQVILPALDDWTGGLLRERYSEIDPSLRRAIASQEIEIWRQNPILGVGPGGAKEYRRKLFGNPIAAHTEYTRLLAEHGLFGAVALVLLLIVVTSAYLRAPTALTKAWVGSLAGWALLEMSHSAMRISAISLLVGLAVLRWREDPGATSRGSKVGPTVPARGSFR